MAKLVYDEQYGELSYAQRAAYRKFNVSPSDHVCLEDVYGSDHAAITQAVKTYVFQGMFSVFEFWNRRPSCHPAKP